VVGELLSETGTDCWWLSERFLGFITMVLKNQRTDGFFSLTSTHPTIPSKLEWCFFDSEMVLKTRSSGVIKRSNNLCLYLLPD
jgi:hypothetical protein